MRSKLTWILTSLMVLSVSFSFAQGKTISGNVTDQAGLPLPGVSVVVVGTSTGAQTDFDGNYSIQANSGQVLRFSYLGQKTVNRTVSTSNTIDVQMEEDAQALEEVVVVGYGTSTKEAFAGTAKTIKAEDIELKNFSNVSQSLAGEAAGVTVINTSGQPGTTSTIRIRGFGSINGNRDPLYVVDGVPYSGSLNAINPSDIKSTTILKDATATAIYGSRGANGVILITTKNGASRDSFVEVDVKSGINAQLIPRYEVVTSPEESIGLIWEAKVNRERLNGNADPIGTANTRLFGTAANSYLAPGYNMWNVANGAELIDPATGQVRDGVTRKYTPERFADIALNPAFRTETNVRMGGGDDKSSYFLSAGYLNEDGVAINTGYERYTMRLNLNSQVKKWLNVGANVGYTYSESINNGQTNGAENLFEFADKMNPIYPVFLRDDNGQLVPDPIFGGNQYDYGSNSGFRARPNSNNLNPIASALYDFNGADRNEVVANFNVKIDIANGLTFETTYGAQYANNVFKSMGNQFYGVSTANEGDLLQSTTESIITNFLQLVRYKKEFGRNSFEAFVAHENNTFDRSFAQAFKAKAIIPQGLELDNYIINLNQPTGSTQVRTLESYFGQINYDYDNKYFLTGTIRRDGSSRFANDKWDTFGAIGAAWVASNESFLANSDLIKFLKVKASYGLTGDEAIPSGLFLGLNTFGVSNVGGGFAVSPSVFANPDLTWEVSKQYQAGLEFSLGNYFDATLDYFIKDTENQFFDRRISPSTGVAVIDVNDGVLRNKGLEFDFTGHLVNTKDFKLDLGINGAMLNNEINVMPIDTETGLPTDFQINGLYGLEQGASIFEFYMREYAGVDPADGFPTWNRYYDDANGNGTFDAGDTSILSLSQYLSENPDAVVGNETTKTYAEATQKFVDRSAIADVAGAFRLNAKYKNFSLSTQFTYSVGGYAYDSQYAELMHDNNGGITAQNRHIDVRNRWRQPGDITDVPLIADRVIPNVNSTSTRFLISSDYLALNNLLLNYDLSKQALDNIGMSGLSIFVSGDNLAFLSSRVGFNSTTSESGNSGRGRYAPLSTLTLGVRAKF